MTTGNSNKWGADHPENKKLTALMARISPLRPQPHSRLRKAWAAIQRALRISDGDSTFSRRED